MSTDDPYTMDWPEIKRDFMVRGYIAFGITSHRAVMAVADLGTESYSATTERLIRAFHRRPSLRTFARLLRAAFLSGIADTRSRL